MRALANGVPVVSVPAAGDMAENASRVQWAGAGLTLPRRFLGERTLRWVVERALGDPRYRERARELAAWAANNDGADRAADLVQIEAFSA